MREHGQDDFFIARRREERRARRIGALLAVLGAALMTLSGVLGSEPL